MCTHNATCMSDTNSPKLMDLHQSHTCSMVVMSYERPRATLQEGKAWLCARWRWQPQRYLLCHSDVLLPDSWPVWAQCWFASGMHHQDTNMQFCCWEWVPGGPGSWAGQLPQERYMLRLWVQPATTKSWLESSAFMGGKLSTAMLLVPIWLSQLLEKHPYNCRI